MTAVTAAKKYLIIPEEQYRGLINATNITTKRTESNNNNELLAAPTEDDNINLSFIKRNLEKSKNKKIKNLSQKRINYMQDLRRYLKIQKELKDRPVKVKLSNG
jgi:predicted RNA-binding protein (virulence factor B family)